jgi:leucyl/phenylalanyl-tRNA--protein transferase
LFPEKFSLSASLKQRIKSGIYTTGIDKDFEGVIRQCAAIERKGQNDTWITDEMLSAYVRLHHNGLAHSFETYHEGRLVGGLYGVSLGRIFFGESMFHLMRDASKVALHCLVEWAILLMRSNPPRISSLWEQRISRETYFLSC